MIKDDLNLNEIIIVFSLKSWQIYDVDFPSFLDNHEALNFL